jgi:predicted nucleic acid-binding protein
MDIVIDTSALLAVVVGEPERDAVVRATTGHSLIGPGCISWEVGNAFFAMLKRKRLPLKEARRGIDIFQSIPVRYVPSDLGHAILIAGRANLYAYDAYFLSCALRQGAPLLTLDDRLRGEATALGVQALEI